MLELNYEKAFLVLCEETNILGTWQTEKFIYFLGFAFVSVCCFVSASLERIKRIRRTDSVKMLHLLCLRESKTILFDR